MTDPARELAATITRLLPRDAGLAEYYAATEAKHFAADTAVGSVFTDPRVRTLDDLLDLAARQRPRGLAGDDRDDLIALGADPHAFMDDIRYLLVRVSGTSGLVDLDTLSDASLLHVVATKPGTPASLVADVDDAPVTGVAVIVIGPRPDDPTREVVWTAHPGLPIAPAHEDTLGHLAGQTITVADARRITGGSTRWALARRPPARTQVTPGR